jgi:hypothetical protein
MKTPAPPVHARHIPDGWIIGLLEDVPDLGTRYPYALISCIGGNRAPDQMPHVRKWVRQRSGHCRFLHGGLLLDIAAGADIREAADEFFDHGDEVCFFEREPVYGPGDLTFTCESPITDTDDAQLGRIARWMHDAGCALCVGDGECGLNFVAVDPRMADFLHAA